MADRRPLVLGDSGVAQELASGDSLQGFTPGVDVPAINGTDNTVTGLQVAVVTALPATPDPNTLYVVTG